MPCIDPNRLRDPTNKTEALLRFLLQFLLQVLARDD